MQLLQAAKIQEEVMLADNTLGGKMKYLPDKIHIGNYNVPNSIH